MKIVFLGPPGAGKGTQSGFICRDYGLVQLSTGDAFRDHMKAGNELGKVAAKYIDKGELVPDDIVINLMKDEIDMPQYANGCIFDGFPRTVVQAIALDEMLAERNDKLDTVLVLSVDNEELIRRLSARWVDRKTGKTYHLLYNPPPEDADVDLYQREDDKESTVRNRLKVYESVTKPLIDYYSAQNKAEMVDGLGKIDEIYAEIQKILNKYR